MPLLKASSTWNKQSTGGPSRTWIAGSSTTSASSRHPTVLLGMLLFFVRCTTFRKKCIFLGFSYLFFSVERKHGCELFTLKTSPSNGKARMQSSFLYLTASMGEESHIFVKSNDRRLHYNGHAFVVRNAGHSAGFDESGMLRIW